MDSYVATYGIDEANERQLYCKVRRETRPEDESQTLLRESQFGYVHRLE